MTYYYIYKIICTAGSLKDHYYIGQHKTTNLDDGYKGSGVMINKYYQKYPNDYVKEILCWCKDENELNEKEDFYVGDLYDTDPLCLNLRAGGNQPGTSEESRRKTSEKMKGKMIGEKHPMYGHHHKEESRRKTSEKMKGRHAGKNNPMYGKGYKISGEKNGMYGRHHTEETRKKQSEMKKNKYIGDKHPQAKIIYVDGQKFTCMKYAYEYIGVSYDSLRMFKHTHNSGDCYKGHKIEWD